MAIRQRLLGPVATSTPAGDAGLAALRIAAGLLLALLHGIGKVPPGEGFVGWIGQMGFPAPLLFAWLAGLAELAGGLLLALGLLTRPVALLVFIHFVVVVFIAHAGDPLAERELAMLFGVIALALTLTGPGRYSLDALIGRDPGRDRG